MTASQATGGMSAVDVYVALSTDGTTWVDVSGDVNSVQTSGGERVTGSVHTFAGDFPILKAGKKGPITVTIRGVYTEDSPHLQSYLQAAYDATGGSSLYARWSYGGGDAGDFGYTTGVGIVKGKPYPDADSESGDPIMTELVLECAVVTKSTIGTAGW